MTDIRDEILGRVSCATTSGEPLYINAGGSKRHQLGRDCDAQVLDISQHTGITEYQSEELVISARAATPLGELQAALAQNNQMLPFEPPLYGGRATIGGTLACNLSGPARPYYGSARDMVLGVELINGKAELLNFGGKVMKNVAGYDVSRLQAGALGTLGVMTEVHLKVLPRPEHKVTLAYEMDAQTALHTMNQRATEPRPLSGACWAGGVLYLRLWGAGTALDHTAREWGGELLAEDATPWEQLREMSLPFFDGEAPLWRLSTASTAPLADNSELLLDWCGSQRWFRGEQQADELQAQADRSGGHLSLFSGGDRSAEVRQPLDPVQKTLQQRLKQSFDPAGILNPGRLYSWM